jgi:hypothetical protein
MHQARALETACVAISRPVIFQISKPELGIS